VGTIIMGWADVIGHIPAKLLALVIGLAAVAFAVLVGVTLVSIFITKQSFDIAGLSFGFNPASETRIRAIVTEMIASSPLLPNGAVVAFNGPCTGPWQPEQNLEDGLIVGARLSASNTATDAITMYDTNLWRGKEPFGPPYRRVDGGHILVVAKVYIYCHLQKP
jgi:hypothetical protein